MNLSNSTSALTGIPTPPAPDPYNITPVQLKSLFSGLSTNGITFSFDANNKLQLILPTYNTADLMMLVLQAVQGYDAYQPTQQLVSKNGMPQWILPSATSATNNSTTTDTTSTFTAAITATSVNITTPKSSPLTLQPNENAVNFTVTPSNAKGTVTQVWSIESTASGAQPFYQGTGSTATVANPAVGGISYAGDYVFVCVITDAGANGSGSVTKTLKYTVSKPTSTDTAPAQSTAYTAYATGTSSSNTTPVSPKMTILNYENSGTLVGSAKNAASAVTYLWGIKSQPAGANAQFNGSYNGGANDNRATVTPINMNFTGDYVYTLTVTDAANVAKTFDFTITRSA